MFRMGPVGLWHAAGTAHAMFAVPATADQSIAHEPNTDDDKKKSALAQQSQRESQGYERYLQGCKSSRDTICTLLGISFDRDGRSAYLLTPFSSAGSLQDLLIGAVRCSAEESKERGKFSADPSCKLSILLDVLAGLQYLHSHRVTHGRLKDTNVLLYHNNSSPTDALGSSSNSMPLRAKLCDGGMTPFLSEEALRKPLRDLDHARWLAPEMLSALFGAFERRRVGRGGARARARNCPSLVVVVVVRVIWTTRAIAAVRALR
jgi:serine/threonine protein kinase